MAARFRLALVGLAFLLSLTALANQPEPTDPADDPLPPGAKVRYGITRPILRTNPSVALLPPRYTNFLTPTINGGIRRYDVGTGRPLEKEGIVGPGQVVVSADGKRAAVSRPGALTVVDVASGKQLLAVTPPGTVLIVGTVGASLSEDGKLLAFGGEGLDRMGTVVVQDVDKNQAVGQFETAQSAPVVPLLSRDGKTLVTHGQAVPPAKTSTTKQAKPPVPMPEPNPESERLAQVWDVATGKELFRARVTGMGGSVVASAFSQDGGLLALSAGDGPVDLWDVKAGKRLHTLLGRKGQGVCVAIAPDGKTVASAGPDYRTQRWTTAGKPIGVSDPPTGIRIAPLTGLTFADNDRVIAWTTADQFALAWDAPMGKLLSPAMDHAAALRSISFPKKGGRDLFTSGAEGRVFRWDFNTGLLNEGIELRPARLPREPMLRPVVTLSEDATRAVRVGVPSEVFDMANGEDLLCIPAPSTPPAAVTTVLSPDGLMVVTVSRQASAKRSGSCVAWDLVTQKRVAEFDVPASDNDSAPVAAVSLDGSRIAIIGAKRNAEGRQVMLVTGFDLKTGKKLGQVEEATGNGSMTFAVADETSLVVLSTSGRLWSVDYVNGRVQEDIDKRPAREALPASPIVFSPDGKRFAVPVGGEPYVSYGVRVYDWPEKKAVRTFIGHAGPVTAIRFSSDGNFVASGAQDTSVLLWDLNRPPREK